MAGGNEIITFTLMFTRCGLRCAVADNSSQTSTFCPRHEVPRSMAGMRLASRNCLPSKVLRLACEAAAFGISYAVACVSWFDG